MATKLSGEFTATGASDTTVVRGKYNFSIGGTFTATVQLQRSFDKGTSWETLEEFTAPTISVREEVEGGVLYRLECTAFTAGPATYRIGF